MIVSSAMAVLPVCRSPMISSRWPRPIGIMPSTALMPVCSGSFTGWRWITPSALRSIGRYASVVIGPRPSIGCPSGIHHAPEHLLPDGHRCNAPGALDGVAFLDLAALAEEDAADVVLFEVQHHAEDAVGEFDELAHEGLGEAVHACHAVAHLEDRADVIDDRSLFRIRRAVCAGSRRLLPVVLLP